MRNFFKKKSWPLILCFLAPIFIMACYFAYRNMSPFGNQSILTVDLGQQYVDMFAYFKHVFFSHPSGILYSFSKAFGGEMFGTWAYYLMSPINLLLLLIPIKFLPAGILIIILIKYGLAGLSFGYLLNNTINPNPYLTIMWSIIYSLNGWIIANQLNIMWLDGMVWLPIVILGVNRICHHDSTKTYVIGITFAVITNYYMGYMITLFTILYTAFKLLTSKQLLTQILSIIKKFIISSAVSFGLCAWLILPTWYSLLKSKHHYSNPFPVNYFEYQPIKMVSKLFNGGLDFSQLPNGTPNIFIGSVAMIGALIYLFQRRITIKKRVGSLIVSLLLILSMCYQPLDLLWHAGQFPIWYPYRFSYIFCFWMIWLAASAINPRYYLSWIPKSLIAIGLSLLIIYIFMNQVKFPYITPLHFGIGIIFILIAFILLLYTHNDSRIFVISLLILSVIEMCFNAFNSLNNLSYLSNQSYVSPTRQLTANVKWINKHQHNNHYRIGKTFYRSKDDPFSNGYFGGDVFDSSLEYTTPRFMKRIGQPEGQGFVTYANGTLLSDELLNYRYFITTNQFHYDKPLFLRHDLSRYPIIHSNHHIDIRKNPVTLPWVYSTYPSTFHIHHGPNPVHNQERWFHAITHQYNVKFRSARFNNVRKSNAKLKHHHLSVQNPLKASDLNLELNPSHHQIYYLKINPEVNRKNFKATINGKPFLPNVTYNHPLILNLNSGLNREPIHLNFRVLQNNIDLKGIHLYRLNANQLSNHKINPRSRINDFSNHQISGVIHATHKQNTLGSSIPATKGWHLKIDGKPTKIRTIDHEFIGASLKPGQHRFKLTFVPPYLYLGITITSMVILSLIIDWKIRKNKRTDYP